MAKAKGLAARPIGLPIDRHETRWMLCIDTDPSDSALLLANAFFERWGAAQADPESAGYQ
jgi:hypothetical protein